jgi:uncharacterized protein YjbI with pentapeptide repeats
MVGRIQRSIAATPEGLEQLEKKRRIFGKTAETIGGLAGVSRSSTQNFFGGKPIAPENFQALCKVLELDWQGIADIQDDTPIKSQKRAAFVINGSLDKLDATQVAKIQALVQTLKNITGDASFVVVDIEEGSIRLILEGSEDGIEKLKQLYEEGGLVDVLEIPIIGVSEIPGTGAESGEDYLKALLVETIRSQGAAGATLSEVSLSNVDLSAVNFNGANLSRTDFSHTDLSRAILSDAILDNAILIGANLRDATIRSTGFSANLSSADLSSADLSSANLSGAILSLADLSRADLSGATLIYANLSGANLSGANLSDANLSGANLSSANVENARFGQGRGLSMTEKLDLSYRGAIFDDALGDRSPTSSPSPIRR